MTHWLISNNPALKLAPFFLVIILVVIFVIKNVFFTIICFLSFFYLLFLSFCCTSDYKKSIDESIKKVVVEEYILLRPLREVDELKQEEMWQEITLKVNSEAAERGLKDYVYTKNLVIELLRSAINDFKTRLNDYKNQEVENRVEWDRVLFIAMNIYNEDLNMYYENKFSSPVWNDYANKKLASMVHESQDDSNC